MPALNTGQIIELPPPYMGQVDQVPLLALQNPYCEILTNFNVDTGKLYLRRGDARFASPTTSIGDWIPNLKTYYSTSGGAKLIACAQILGAPTTLKWYDITAGGSGVLLHSGPAPGGDDEIHTSEFNGSLYYWGEASLQTIDGKRYDGASWTSTPYTFSTTFHPFMGRSHNNRHYMAERYSCNIAYPAVDAVSGTATVLDLGSIFNSKGYISTLRSVSIADTIESKSFLVLVNNVGEIICYDGRYPEAADWRIVARFKIPAPISWETGLDIDGDWLQITKTGMFSVRDLFMKGNKLAIQQAITAPIATRWRQVMGALSGFQISQVKAIWDADNERILILVPYYVDRSGAVDLTKTLWIIYDTRRQAWLEHISNHGSGGWGMDVYQGRVYFSTGDRAIVQKKEGRSDYVDRKEDDSGNNAYTYQIRSAPIPLPRSRNTRITGLELITKGDYYSTTKVTLRGDLGVTTTGNHVIPSQGTGLAKPFLSVGIDSNVVQYDISQDGGSSNPASVGCEIYGVNVHFEPGGAR